MNEQIKVDRRILKTKKAIRKALIKLLSEKDLSNITITKIAQEADINRKTFYHYYDSVYQVIDEVEDDIVNSFDSIVSHINLKRDLKKPTWIFESLTQIIDNDFDFYSDLMKTEKFGNLKLIAKLSEAFKQRVKENIPDDLFEDDFSLEMTIDYVIAGMMEVYQEWLKKPNTVSLEDLSKKMSIITFSGISGLIGAGDE